MAKNKDTILIVEDDKFLVKAYQIKFSKAGFDVITAMDGVTGLEVAKTLSPSLVVLDLMMPKMNGFEFLKAAKSDDTLKNVPVIVLSNLGQESDKAKALALGAADYLVKTDYKLEEIIDRIKTIL